MDDRVVPSSPMAAIAAGEGDEIPLLAGTNLDEYRYWLMVDPRLPSLTTQKLGRRLREVTGGDPEPIVEAYRRSRPSLDDNQIAITLLGDIAFRLPTLRMAEARSGRGAGNWMYLFTRPSPVQGGRLGAAHAMDVPFVFGTLDAPQIDKLIGDGPDRAPLSRAMQDAWIAFARTGDPSHAGPSGVAAVGHRAAGHHDLRRAVPARARSAARGASGLGAASFAVHA